jgi:dienelactone hydrolase
MVTVRAGPVMLDGDLFLPEQAKGLVVFVQGSDGNHSQHNQYVARAMQRIGLGTLLFDLLTLEEEEVDLRTHQLCFDGSLLARRAIGAADWLAGQTFTRGLKLGFFGASAGATAALIAAAERPEMTGAVVSRGGRPDLADNALPHILAPTLLITAQMDGQVTRLNEQALERMDAKTEKELAVIPGATHAFKEPGALESVSRLAADWFRQHLLSK